MLNNSNYGQLITPPVDLQRQNFEEMCKLIGVKVKYQTPKPSSDVTNYGELKYNYNDPEDVWCIVTNHLDQKTSKLLGWNVELDTEASVVSLPYNLHDLQVGCLVEIPSAFDDAPGRKMKIVEMSTKMIYPASVSCKLVPEYEDTAQQAEIEFFNNSDFNLLYEGD